MSIFFNRPIAITDVETTGLDFRVHEIVDVGLVLVDQTTLDVVDTFSSKVQPTNLVTATQKALEVNGYNAIDWQNAPSLVDVLAAYSAKTVGAVFAAHNVTFDWGFIDEGFRKARVQNRMDYHRIDMLTLAWSRLRNKGLKKLNQNAVAEFLGVAPEPAIHSGINGAMLSYQIFRKLMVEY